MHVSSLSSDWKQQKKKRSHSVGLPSYRGLAEVAARCLCELLIALPHFNFHNNIIIALAPLMNDSDEKVTECLECAAMASSICNSCLDVL